MAVCGGRVWFIPISESNISWSVSCSFSSCYITEKWKGLVWKERWKERKRGGEEKEERREGGGERKVREMSNTGFV